MLFIKIIHYSSFPKAAVSRLMPKPKKRSYSIKKEFLCLPFKSFLKKFTNLIFNFMRLSPFELSGSEAPIQQLSGSCENLEDHSIATKIKRTFSFGATEWKIEFIILEIRLLTLFFIKYVNMENILKSKFSTNG